MQDQESALLALREQDAHPGYSQWMKRRVALGDAGGSRRSSVVLVLVTGLPGLRWPWRWQAVHMRALIQRSDDSVGLDMLETVSPCMCSPTCPPTVAEDRCYPPSSPSPAV